MELHEIESAIILAEAEAILARKTHAHLTETRDALKKSVSSIKDKAAQEIYQIQLRYEQEQAAVRAKCEVETREADQLYHSLQSEQWDAQRAKAAAERLLDDLQRQLDIARRANLKAAEFAVLQDRWNLLTMGAPWREWAKDHQIDGAKKIVYEGKMILGDTMGLGKTLTSLIAIDMIQAATQDASEEFPALFGSMD